MKKIVIFAKTNIEKRLKAILVKIYKEWFWFLFEKWICFFFENQFPELQEIYLSKTLEWLIKWLSEKQKPKYTSKSWKNQGPNVLK